MVKLILNNVLIPEWPIIPTHNKSLNQIQNTHYYPELSNQNAFEKNTSNNIQVWEGLQDNYAEPYYYNFYAP